METGKAIYYLLKDSDAVGAICADRIYPEIAQQDADAPFIAYTVIDTTPSGTKTSSSNLDTARCEIYMISDDYAQAMDLGIAVRAALDRQGGDIGPVGNTVAVQSIDFESSDIDHDEEHGVYIVEHTYNIRVQRTGQAGSFTVVPSNAITVEEADGDPSGPVTKLVFSNGTVSIVGTTATVASGGGGSLTVQETSAANSNTADTLEFPTESVTHASGKATISFLQGLVSEYGFDALLTDTYFPNGLYGDINQDGVVGTSDFLALLGNFGATTSPTADDVARAFDLAESQISSGNSSFFSNAQYSKAANTKSSLETAGHVVEYFQGVNTALGGGYVQDWDSDTDPDNTVRRTLYISSTSFPTSLSQFQVYPLGPYDDTAKATVQAVVDAFVSGSTGNFSIVVIRTLISNSPNKLLDTYTGAAAAYSVRLLDKDYTGYCMKVRRASDDAEADIGFDSNGDLDTASIASHCGSANGYVVTWYDQSGNSNNATQSTAGSQLQIYNGTAVITRNGKPMLESTVNVTSFSTVSLSQNTPYTLMGVSYNHNAFNRALAYGNGGNMKAVAAVNKALFQYSSSFITASATYGDSSIIYTAVANGSSSFVRGLGETTSAQTTGTVTDVALTNLQPGGEASRQSSLQEVILWDGAKSATDYGAIETNMNNYFSVS